MERINKGVLMMPDRGEAEGVQPEATGGQEGERLAAELTAQQGLDRPAEAAHAAETPEVSESEQMNLDALRQSADYYEGLADQIMAQPLDVFRAERALSAQVGGLSEILDSALAEVHSLEANDEATVGDIKKALSQAAVDMAQGYREALTGS